MSNNGAAESIDTSAIEPEEFAKTIGRRPTTSCARR
jgi:hypothetical protein